MEAKLEFRGTGAELFKTLFVGALLTAITFGIYAPWYMVDLQRYVYSRTKIRGTTHGDLQPEFDGKGGELFKVGLIGLLLTSITLGIYGAWFLADLTRYFNRHSRALATDGTAYSLDSKLTGGELFKTVFVGGLLSTITLGIYLPWFMCKLNALVLGRTSVLRNGAAAGSLRFTGQGGELFVTFLGGYLLGLVTLGIYLPWFQVKLYKFMSRSTKLTIAGREFSGNFTGEGGELFVTMLVGGLLTSLTLGIYGFWFMAKLLKFQLDHTAYRAGPIAPSDPAPAFPAMPARA
jgi:uncharacterized membrane protein YjgN (DUF898 family)